MLSDIKGLSYTHACKYSTCLGDIDYPGCGRIRPIQPKAPPFLFAGLQLYNLGTYNLRV